MKIAHDSDVPSPGRAYFINASDIRAAFKAIADAFAECPECERPLSSAYFANGREYETCERCQRQIKRLSNGVLIGHPGRCKDSDPCDLCRIGSGTKGGTK